MPLGRFSLMTLLGSAAWNALLIGLGWALGSRYELVDRYSGMLDRVVVAAAVALVGWLVVRRVRRVRRARRLSPDDDA
jgi:membrane protein DedA with SNARE-associated domain